MIMNVTLFLVMYLILYIVCFLHTPVCICRVTGCQERES